MTIQSELDEEWYEFIMYAKELGLTIDEIRDFFKQAQNRKKQ